MARCDRTSTGDRFFKYTKMDNSTIKSMTSLELEFATLWEELYPNIDLVFQYRVKRYRLDFCHVETKTAIECQGGTWTAGLGHSSGKGIESDCKKFCTLASMGFVVLPLTCKMITSQWLDAIAQTINLRLEKSI